MNGNLLAEHEQFFIIKLISLSLFSIFPYLHRLLLENALFKSSQPFQKSHLLEIYLKIYFPVHILTSYLTEHEQVDQCRDMKCIFHSSNQARDHLECCLYVIERWIGCLCVQIEYHYIVVERCCRRTQCVANILTPCTIREATHLLIKYT